MKRTRTRSIPTVLLLLALVATGPAAFASESDAKSGAADAAPPKAEPAPKAAETQAESDPNAVCVPNKDTAEFNTLEDIYVGLATDLLTMLASAPAVGGADVGVADATKTQSEMTVVWRPASRD
jgi:hypothetical protein